MRQNQIKPNQIKTEEKQFHGYFIRQSGGACGVMVIVAGYGHGDTSSNPGRH